MTLSRGICRVLISDYTEFPPVNCSQSFDDDSYTIPSGSLSLCSSMRVFRPGKKPEAGDGARLQCNQHYSLVAVKYTRSA